MKKFIHYFKAFHKEYFNVSLYSFVTLLTAALIALNYTIDLENSYIDLYAGKFIRIFLYLALYCFSYFGTVFILWMHNKHLPITRQYLLKSFLAILILSIDRSSYLWISDLFIDYFPQEARRFFFRTFANAYGIFTIVLSLGVLKIIFDPKEREGLYGLRFKKVDIKPYLTILLLISIIIYLGSFMPDILKYYPTYKRAGGAEFAELYGITEKLSVLIYEFFYLFDFAYTELLFRGFLIIGLSRLLGKNVVLPMTVLYASVHFGKPLGETICSVFGGYLLGIIALYSRNIWGGVFIHGGVAMFMELFAYLKQ